MKVPLTPLAQADLQDIRNCLVEESPVGADRVRQAVLGAISLLSRRPDIGIRDFAIPNVRSKLVTGYPYRIHYRVRSGVLEILHIRHTARRPWTAEDR